MIDTCPRCRYSLTGLPDKHTCPECGLDYDRDSVVVKQARGMWVLLLILCALALFVGLALAVHRGRLGSLAITLLIMAALLARAIWELCRTGITVIVSDSEVRILRGSRREEVVSTPEIGLARWNWVDGDVEIVGQDGKVLARVARQRLWSTWRARRIVTEINKRVGKETT